MVAGLDVPLDDAAERRREGLIVDHPALGESGAIHDQVGRADEILHVTEGGRGSGDLLGGATGGDAEQRGGARGNTKVHTHSPARDAGQACASSAGCQAGKSSAM